MAAALLILHRSRQKHIALASPLSSDITFNAFFEETTFGVKAVVSV